MADYTPQRVLEIIRETNEKYPDAAHSYAHIVVDDLNLDDSSIKHCQQSPLFHEWLRQAIIDLPKELPAQAYVERVKQLLETREQLVSVLVWLGSVPEEVRDQAMDIAHGNGRDSDEL